ncbi:MAG: DNA primase, partial [Flavobacteriales bacterium]
MKRVIVDYIKIPEDILQKLVEKYPLGYKNRDIITFTNAKGERVEAVELKTEDTIYLVKVSQKLVD